MDRQLQKKYESLLKIIKNYNSAAVAFSGGADSTLLTYVANEALNGNVTAYTISNVMIPEDEKNTAVVLAKELKVSHKVIQVDILNVDGVAKNPKNRCYICKKAIMKIIKSEADKDGREIIFEGSNYDDLSDYRPGMKAVKEADAVSPLAQAELKKSEIRAILKEKNISVWDKPAMPCLASRIPYGEEITALKLSMVEKAEKVLMESGFTQVRVRHHGTIARIEINLDDIPKLLENNMRAYINNSLKQLGFVYVTIDIGGFKSGNLNIN